MAKQVLEGLWEEIVQHADELSGKKVRLTVIDAMRLERPLSEALEGIVGAVDSTDGSQHGHSTTPFAEIISEKFRKQGLKIP
jgi:hypothetical protein